MEYGKQFIKGEIWKGDLMKLHHSGGFTGSQQEFVKCNRPNNKVFHPAYRKSAIPVKQAFG